MKWILWFILGVALIAVYKTFDNFRDIITFFKKIFVASAPVIAGGVIAYILNIPCRKLEKAYSKINVRFIREKSVGLSIISVYVIFIAIIVTIIKVILPGLINNIVDFSNNIIPFAQHVYGDVDKLQTSLGVELFKFDEETIRTAIQGLFSKINIDGVGKYAKGAISFASGILDVFIAFVISVYILIDRERLKSGYERVTGLLLPPDKIGTFRKYSSRINAICSSYIYSCVLDAATVAILATVILSLIGVKYAMFFGIFIGVCNLIPYFGAFISNVVTVVMTGFITGWGKAIWAAVTLLILGQIDANFIGPKIMGNKLDVRPLWIIFAVSLGGGLFGIPGMVLSVPVMMIIKIIFEEILENIEEKRTAETEE